MFIKELIDSKRYVTLITRPRRFGKSFNLSMLRYFFSPKEKDRNKKLFENLEIGKDHKFMEDYQGKIPVIYLTMKECSSNCYENFLSELRLMMQDFLDSYPEIKDEAVSKPVTRQRYEAILNGSASEAALAKSLADIMKIMERNYDHKVAVLIDEYDAPVFNIVSDESNNRMKILNFMSRFYGNAMKDNPCLAFALITGVHRIAKENLFSGFNNLSVSNVQNGVFSSYFGFTFNDVKNCYRFQFGKFLRKYEGMV